MINIKKKIVVSALVLTILGASVIATNQVFAQGANTGPFSTLVQKIANKFNLNKDDVQAVFDQFKTDHQTATQNQFIQKLDQAVRDGKITDAQKQLILAKQQELQANRKVNFDNFKNMTPDQRKTAMQAQKQVLSDWAKQNNIDLQYLFSGRMGRFGGMRGRWNMK